MIALDTFDCVLDLGFHIKLQHGKEGKAILKEWLEGKEIVIRTHKDESDKFGRFLATVIFQEEYGTVNLGDWIVANGYGVWTNAKGEKLQ